MAVFRVRRRGAWLTVAMTERSDVVAWSVCGGCARETGESHHAPHAPRVRDPGGHALLDSRTGRPRVSCRRRGPTVAWRAGRRPEPFRQWSRQRWLHHVRNPHGQQIGGVAAPSRPRLPRNAGGRRMRTSPGPGAEPRRAHPETGWGRCPPGRRATVRPQLIRPPVSRPTGPAGARVRSPGAACPGGSHASGVPGFGMARRAGVSAGASGAPRTAGPGSRAGPPAPGRPWSPTPAAPPH